MKDISDFTIAECDETIEKYGLTDFPTYVKTVFPRMSEAARFTVLSQWDEMLSNESRVTKEFAGHIERKRQLNDLHFFLKRNGR